MRISTRTAANRTVSRLWPKLTIRQTSKRPSPTSRRPGICYADAIDSVAIFLDECQAFDLTPLQYVALSALATLGPMDKATIGGVVALDRTTVAVVVKNLEQRGLATTRPSEYDRRAKLVKITAKGLSLASSAQAQVAKAQERTVAPLTAKERDELLRLLRKIAQENNLLSRAPRRAPPAAVA